MRIPAPGRMVDVGGRRLHLSTAGSGQPVVVLEAGIASTSVSWSLVQKSIAQFTTVVSYDRAGLGWSDPVEPCGTALQAAEDLALLLERAALPGPFVLVGHSFGALIVRIFQQHWPERVAGLVLVDPLVRSEWRQPDEEKRRMLARGVLLSRRGALLARLGVVRIALMLLAAGSHTIPKLLARASAGNGATVTDRLVGEVRKMPRELWPAIAAHWSRPRSFRTMAEYLENLPLSVNQLDENRSLGNLPLRVLSAGKVVPEHAREVSLSTAADHVVVRSAGHWLQLDAPSAVVQAVVSVLTEVRTG